MQTHTIELNYNNYSVPDTASIRASDFNVITHSIIKNVKRAMGTVLACCAIPETDVTVTE